MERDSIWSVTRGAQHAYFILFTVQFIVAGILLLYEREVSSWVELAELWSSLAPVAIASAAIAVIVTEVGVYVMVLARGLAEKIERRKQERIEQGRREGREAALKAVFDVLANPKNRDLTLEELRSLVEEERDKQSDA